MANVPQRKDQIDPLPSGDGGGDPPNGSSVEERLSKVEADISVMKVDIAVIKAIGATKSDIAYLRSELKAAIADSRASVILWVTTAIFLGQILPSLLKLATP